MRWEGIAEEGGQTVKAHAVSGLLRVGQRGSKSILMHRRKRKISAGGGADWKTGVASEGPDKLLAGMRSSSLGRTLSQNSINKSKCSERSWTFLKKRNTFETSADHQKHFLKTKCTVLRFGLFFTSMQKNLWFPWICHASEIETKAFFFPRLSQVDFTYLFFLLLLSCVETTDFYFLN